MGTHLQLPPEILRQLRLKVREGAERRTALYNELHGAFRELAELAGRSKRRIRQGDHEGFVPD